MPSIMTSRPRRPTKDERARHAAAGNTYATPFRYTGSLKERHADAIGVSLRARVARAATELSELEIFWQERQIFLESKGYILRPRYCKDWEPSFGKILEIPNGAEDAIPLPVSCILLHRHILHPIKPPPPEFVV